MTSSSSPAKVGQYLSFYDEAYLYDPLRADDDYDSWAQLLTGLVQRYVPGPTRLLDVGCGTGNSAMAFARMGYEVTGCDISRAMLEVAVAKDSERLIQYRHADMRSLPSDLGKFSVVNWMDDVANHLTTLDDLVVATRSSAARLVRGGVLIFDVNATAAFRAITSQHHVIDRGDILFHIVPYERYSPPYELVTVKISSFVSTTGTLWHRNEHIITERYFSYDDIASALGEAGLEIVEAYSLHNDKLFAPPDEENHGKVIYVASAPRSS